MRSAALDRSCGDTAVHFYEGEPDLLRQRGRERLSIGVKGRSRRGGTAGGLRSHHPCRVGTGSQGLLRAKGGFYHHPEGESDFNAQPAARALFSWAFHPQDRVWMREHGPAPEDILQEGWPVTPLGGIL